jgi:adenylate cyclase
MYGYMANVLASIASGVVTTDEYGIIRTYNRAAAGIFGIQPEQAMGQSYRDVFGLLANSPVPALFNQVQESGEPVLGHEARVVVPGRGEVTLLLNVARVVAETGEKLGVVVVIEDITQERRMERYIAPNVVEHLITASAGPKLGGELRDITVLFGDVQGYTTLSEKMAPEELIDLLNTHLSLAGSTIMDATYAGTLDKYIGDAVMGLFNTPQDQPDHAWRAICSICCAARLIPATSATPWPGWPLRCKSRCAPPSSTAPPPPWASTPSPGWPSRAARKPTTCAPCTPLCRPSTPRSICAPCSTW